MRADCSASFRWATCVKRYLDAVSAGLLKIMSKMGISVISSYRGAYHFEAVGLSRSMVADIFPACPAAFPVSDFPASRRKVARLHARAFDEDVIALPIGGFYKARAGGETHAHAAPSHPSAAIAVASNSYGDVSRNIPTACGRCRRCRLRHLMDFRAGAAAIALEDVESITEIRKRFVTPGMSLGALVAGSARSAQHRHEPHRREIRFRRRRRRPGAVPAPSPTATTPTPRSSRSRSGALA